MDTTSKLYSQVAVEAGVSIERAMVGCYLSDLSRSGKTLDDAAQLMRSTRSSVRCAARDWGISFSDFTPGSPVRLEWEKERRGRWILKSGKMVVAEAASFTEGGVHGYRAKTIPDGLTQEGSSAEVAIRRLSLAMEAMSAHTLHADDVEIHMPGVGQVAPKVEPLAANMKRALSA